MNTTILFVGALVKSSCYLFGFHDVYEGMGVYFLDGADDDFAFFAGDYGIDYFSLMVFVGAFTFHDGSAVVADLGDGFIYFLGVVGYDKQGLLLVSFV